MKSKRPAFKKAVHKAFNANNPREKIVIQFLLDICEAHWFSKIGKKHPRDFNLIRIADLKNVNRTLKLLSDRRKVSGPLWAKVQNKAVKERQVRRLEYIVDKTTELFKIHLGVWHGVKKTGKLNLMYNILGDDVSLACGAIFINEPVAKRWWMELVSLYVEGYWPCGWQGKYPDGTFVVI